MLELEQLRCFLAVVDCGGFRRAADRLELAQSKVSQQVARLEQQLGRTLLLRTTRRVRLSDDGEAMLEEARQLLDAELALRTRLTRPALSGRIRLGAAEEVACGSLPGALAKFARANPQVTLEVNVGTSVDLIRACEEGTLDLVLIKRPPGSSKGEPLWRDELHWVTAQHLPWQPSESLALALYQQDNSISRTLALEALRKSKQRFRIAYTSFSLAGLRAAALAGLAVAVLPASAIGSGLRILGEADGLPALRPLQYVMLRRSRRSGDQALNELHQLLISLRSTV